MCKSKERRSSSSLRSPKRMKSAREDPPKQSEIDDFIRCLQQDIIDQQENSQNLSNQNEVRSLRRSLEVVPDKSSVVESASERTPRRTTKKRSDSGSQVPETSHSIESSQPIDEPDQNDLISQASSVQSSVRSPVQSSVQSSSTKTTKKRTNKKLSTHLERVQEDFASTAKSVHSQSNDQFRPLDCVYPAYLLKEALNSHRLNEIAQLCALNAKEKSICPYLLSKSGFLMFRKFVEWRPEMEAEVCADLADFVKHIKYLTGSSYSSFEIKIESTNFLFLVQAC